MRKGSYVMFFLVVMCFFPAPRLVWSHGTTYEILKDHSAITVQCSYSTDEPMAYAEVMVFGPVDQNIEFQNGRTDRQGRFAFCPDREGLWRVRVNDGMGHVINAEMNIDDTGTPAIKGDSIAEPGRSRAAEIIAGLSLIINIFLGAYIWKGTERRCQ